MRVECRYLKLSRSVIGNRPPLTIIVRIENAVRMRGNNHLNVLIPTLPSCARRGYDGYAIRPGMRTVSISIADPMPHFKWRSRNYWYSRRIYGAQLDCINQSSLAGTLTNSVIASRPGKISSNTEEEQ